jgi:hypothetical protein
VTPSLHSGWLHFGSDRMLIIPGSACRLQKDGRLSPKNAWEKRFLQPGARQSWCVPTLTIPCTSDGLKLVQNVFHTAKQFQALLPHAPLFTQNSKLQVECDPIGVFIVQVRDGSGGFLKPMPMGPLFDLGRCKRHFNNLESTGLARTIDRVQAVRKRRASTLSVEHPGTLQTADLSDPSCTG